MGGERRPGQPGRPGRVRLDPALIVAEAVRLARAEGAEAVTMRRLANELGTAPMSLYRHHADRRALMIAMLDEVARRIDLPEPVDDPRAEIAAVLTAIHDALRREVWAVPLLVVERLAGPSIMPVLERLFRALRQAGLTPRDSLAAYALLWQYTSGELLESHHTTPETYSARMMRGAGADQYPAIAEAMAANTPSTRGDWFPENLRRLLDGLLPGQPAPAETTSPTT